MQSSIDRDKVRIDFEKLEGELNAAVAREQKYWRENDAKLRAVEQRVASYDEFKDIVAASHLKPLGRLEHVDTLTTNRQPWNTYATGSGTGSFLTDQMGTGEESNQPVSSSQTVLPRPTNVHSFLRGWRQLADPGPRYQHLRDLGPATLTVLFKPDIGFGLLGDFLHCFKHEAVASESSAGEIMALLEALAGTDRFQLAVQFFSGAEKTTCCQLFDRLRELMAVDSTPDHLNQQMKKLRTLYGIN